MVNAVSTICLCGVLRSWCNWVARSQAQKENPLPFLARGFAIVWISSAGFAFDSTRGSRRACHRGVEKALG